MGDCRRNLRSGMEIGKAENRIKKKNWLQEHDKDDQPSVHGMGKKRLRKKNSLRRTKPLEGVTNRSVYDEQL